MEQQHPPRRRKLTPEERRARMERRQARERKKQNFWSWIISIATIIIVVILMKRYVINSVLVDGESMLPTFENHNQVFTKQDAIVGEYRHGDVIVFDPPMDYYKEGYFIKRIIGMPGDHIEFKGGQVLLNGNALEEDYTARDITDPYEQTEYQVPEGCVFVLGDNRNPGASMDSRVFGPVPIKNIQGVVVFRYWPFGSFGKISRGE